jgi:serine protease DegS
MVQVRNESARDFTPNVPFPVANVRQPVSASASPTKETSEKRKEKQARMHQPPLLSSWKVPALSALLGAALAVLVLTIASRIVPADNVTGFSDGVALASPAVVTIYSERSVRPRFCEDDRYRRWCSGQIETEAGRRERALGSGVIVRRDGFIITNDHVIARASEILVGLADGRLNAAEVIGRDPETDLAVVRISATDLHVITPAKTSTLRVGDIALAIGNPYGIGQTVSQGIVSAIGRNNAGVSGWGDFIQTDAAINPGNSGGALINERGELIGINTRILNRATAAQGIGFAIPVDLVERVVDSLIRDGRVRRAWFGLEVEEQPAALRSGPALRIVAVDDNGPAMHAGIKPDDGLIAVNDRMPQTAMELARLIAQLTPGTAITLTIERGREIRETTLKVAERPAELRPTIESEQP